MLLSLYMQKGTIENLKKLIQGALEANVGVSDASFSLEHPAMLAHGDFATNAAMVVAKSLGKNPIEVALEIVAYIEKHKDASILKASVAGPGFINITLAPSVFLDTVQSVLESPESWGKNELHAGEKILIEHSSPNLFKPFHIGHVMNNTIGESIKRLAAYSGADVVTISYPSDVSLGIGKAVWYLLQDEGVEKIERAEYLSTAQLSYLGDCYVQGTRAFEENEKVQAEVRAITKLIYDKTPSPAYDAYMLGKELSLGYFKKVVARLGSAFDDFIFESEAGVEGEKLVRMHTDIFTESDGAVIYEGEKDGFHTRVFINKEGYPTYEAKDVGLLALKFARFAPDISIFITDNQQSEYFKVVANAAGKIKKLWQEKTIHRTHGRMSFKGAKMSSRLGGVPVAQEVLDAICEEVRERGVGLSKEAEDMISIASLKFVVLRTMAGKDLNFDPATSLSFEGDSGPYLQYTAVRAGAVLQKAAGLGLMPKLMHTPPDDTEVLERYIARFPEVVAHATAEWAPHYIVTYLLELAQAFNSWYGQTKIIDDSDNTFTAHRLAIAKVVETTIHNGLYILGIQVPEKM